MKRGEGERGRNKKLSHIPADIDQVDPSEEKETSDPRLA